MRGSAARRWVGTPEPCALGTTARLRVCTLLVTVCWRLPGTLASGSCLLPLEVRGSLLEEGPRPFLHVLRRGHLGEGGPPRARGRPRAACRRPRSTASVVSATATGPLARIWRRSAAASARSASAGTTFVTRPMRYASWGVDRLAGEEEVQGAAPADEAREALRPAVSGDEAELHLRLAELRVLAGDAEVARHRELAAAAQREAVHRGHDRLPHRLVGRDHRLAGERHRAGLAHAEPREFRDVRAGDERLGARPGDDHAPDRGVGAGRARAAVVRARRRRWR